MDYSAMLDSARQTGSLCPRLNGPRDAQQQYRIVVQEPPDYAEDMMLLDRAEARLSGMVASGVISGLEALRFERAIPEARKRLKATRKVFRVKVRKAEDE